MQRFEPPLTRTVFVRLVSNERHPPWSAEETFEALSRLYPETVLDVRSYRDHKESQLVTFATVADAKRAIDDFKWERERERERDRGSSGSSSSYSSSFSASLSALRVGFLSMERRLARRWLWLGGLQVHDEDPEDKGVRNPRKLEGEVRDRLRRKVFEELWKRIDGRDGFLEKGLSSPPQFFVRLGLHGVFLSFRKIEEAAKTAERLLTMNGINTNTGQFNGGVPTDLDIRIVMNERLVAEWRRMSVDFCEEADVDVQPSDLQNQPHELDDDFRRPDEPYRERDQRGSVHDDYHRSSADQQSSRHRGPQDEYSRSYRGSSSDGIVGGGAGDSWTRGRASSGGSLTPKRRNSPGPGGVGDDEESQRLKRLRGGSSRDQPLGGTSSRSPQNSRDRSRSRSRSPPPRVSNRSLSRSPPPRSSRHSPTPPPASSASSSSRRSPTSPSTHPSAPSSSSYSSHHRSSSLSSSSSSSFAQLVDRVRTLETTVTSLLQMVHSLTNNGVKTGAPATASETQGVVIKTSTSDNGIIPVTATASIVTAPSNSTEATNGETAH